MPKVSIIIPAFNPGDFLREAIQSIYEQSFSDWELIVVDDASSEDLRWIPIEFPKAKLIRQQHGGSSVARNRGILNSTGEFIAFMDQDDLWRSGKLSSQVAALEQEVDAALVHCDLEFFYSDGRPSKTPTRNGGSTDFLVELDGSAKAITPNESNLVRSLRYFSKRFVVPSSVLVRRSCLATTGLFDPLIPFTGDYDLIIKLGSKYKIIRIPVPDARYRRHANNFSNQYEVCRFEVEALISRYVAFGREHGDKLLVREAPRLLRPSRKLFGAQAFDWARRSLRERNYKALAYHLTRAVYLNPVYTLGSALKWLKPHAVRSSKV